jgi:hypothetical protein
MSEKMRFKGNLDQQMFLPLQKKLNILLIGETNEGKKFKFFDPPLGEG